MSDWYKLDTAAKLFPSVANMKNTSVFRVSAVLNEVVDAQVLQDAADTVIDRFPTLAVKLRKGLFWNYLEPNAKRFLVEEETQYPCYRIKPKSGNGYLLKVLFDNHRISVEVFHSLTDGNGAIEFLKALVYYYLTLSGISIDHENRIMLADDAINWCEVEDSFTNYYERNRSKATKSERAYRIVGTPFENFGNNVLHGVMDASALNAIAKQKGATMTAYLTALLMYSMYQTRLQYGQYTAPIVIAVPVNLRKALPSKTLRNFFNVANISIKITKAISFDELVQEVSAQIKEKTRRETLQNGIAANIRLEKNKALKLLPLFAKHFFIHFSYHTLSRSKKTMTLSNLGNIVLPQEMSAHVQQFEALLYPTNVNPMSCAMTTVNNRLNITFTRTIRQADIIQYFFSYLSMQAGLNVEIYSNDWGLDHEKV